MLIKKDLQNGNKTIWTCDRCGKQVTKKSLAQIYVKDPVHTTTPIKAYDFCLKCYKALINGVQAYKTKRSDGNHIPYID